MLWHFKSVFVLSNAEIASFVQSYRSFFRFPDIRLISFACRLLSVCNGGKNYTSRENVWVIALILSGFGLSPVSETLSPKNSISFWPKPHLLELITTPLSSSVLNYISRCFRCSSSEVDEINMSSKYASQKSRSLIIPWMNRWNVCVAFFNPNCISINSYKKAWSLLF